MKRTHRIANILLSSSITVCVLAGVCVCVGGGHTSDVRQAQSVNHSAGSRGGGMEGEG